MHDDERDALEGAIEILADGILKVHDIFLCAKK